jgi:hypothetical protein
MIAAGRCALIGIFVFVFVCMNSYEPLLGFVVFAPECHFSADAYIVSINNMACQNKSNARTVMPESFFVPFMFHGGNRKFVSFARLDWPFSIQIVPSRAITESW